MDKNEFNLRMDQMKSLLADEKFDEAAEIADTINWNKIKNATTLLKIGEVYEKAGRYADSKEVLLAAFDRSPIGRGILYRLAEVAIKMNDINLAKEYYDEFVSIAPHDNLKYVLRYNILKAQGADESRLIPILEELHEQEYTEEWAYELAYLYHKAGLVDKCIEACDELILWFGDGPYVERALELKMLYQPLTKAQKDKYSSFRQARDGYTHINIEAMQRAGEYGHEPVAIPEVTLNPERFNTMSLQEVVANGMQQIQNATEKETVKATLDNLQKIEREISYLRDPLEGDTIDLSKQGRNVTPEVHYETDEEIDGSLNINFQEMLSEESDGQYHLMTNDKSYVERQITGQITIDEILEEWNRTKRAAEAVLKDAEQRKLESAKARALQEANHLMDRLTDARPQLDAGVTPRDIFEEDYQKNKQLTDAITNAVMEDSLSELTFPEVVILEEATETSEADIFEESAILEEMDALEEAEILEEMKALEGTELLEEPEASEEAEFAEESVALEETEFVEESVALEEAELTEESDALEEAEFAEESVALEETELTEESVALEETELMEEPEALEEAEFAEESVALEEVESTEESDTLEVMELPEEPKQSKQSSVKDTKRRVVTEALTEQQKATFSYFMPVKGMEKQLSKAITEAKRHFEEDETSCSGNIIIQGEQGCGKTTLATSLIKVLQQETGHPSDKIGKIHASALNKKDVGVLYKKVAGGCLIIEQAGDLSRNAAVTLGLLLETDKEKTLIILEDSSMGIKKALSQDSGFAQKFTETITVPMFTNDELVVFARSYSKELGYDIDEMAILALYNRISNIQRYDQATTLTEVKEIVDEAIAREARGGLKKYFTILTASRYTDDDRIVLREKHFA